MISDIVQISLITAIAPILAGVVNHLMTRREFQKTNAEVAVVREVASRAAADGTEQREASRVAVEKLEAHATEMAESVQQIRKEANGMHTALLKVTGDAEFAKGFKQGGEEAESKR